MSPLDLPTTQVLLTNSKALAGEFVGTLFDSGDQSCTFLGAKLASEDGLHTFLMEGGGLDYKEIEIIENVTQRVRLAAPPGLLPEGASNPLPTFGGSIREKKMT